MSIQVAGKPVKKPVLQELERIRQKDPDGILHPEEVVEAAAPESSPLHDYFTWDDTEAARQHRLNQARHLIRVTVTVLPGTNTQTRAYVSLSVDRPPREVGTVTGGGGFRDVVTVLSNEDLRRQLLQDAIKDMTNFQNKFRTLEELSEVFSAMSKTQKALQTKSKSKRMKKGR